MRKWKEKDGKIKIREIFHHEQRIRWIETEIHAQNMCGSVILSISLFLSPSAFLCEHVFACATKRTSEAQIVAYEKEHMKNKQNERTSS